MIILPLQALDIVIVYHHYSSCMRVAYRHNNVWYPASWYLALYLFGISPLKGRAILRAFTALIMKVL
jgi:hypothetical protein